MTVLVTGAAGFIGFHVAASLSRKGHQVIGLDNLNDYYDPSLKSARLKKLSQETNFVFYEQDLIDAEKLAETFAAHPITKVVNLAAQAGVRYSIENPMAYVQSNIVGFQTLLEACRIHNVEHLVYASSSSVYGNSNRVPFSVDDQVDKPISTYAATKKSNELMAHVYSHLFGLRTTGLRFFTVYGPWGRPDMSPFLFADAIFNGETLRLFNHGNHQRDFTFIDDIVEGVISVLESNQIETYKVYNIGNSKPVQLLDYVRTLESEIGIEAKTELVGPQAGDVEVTYADVSELEEDIGYRPDTSLEDGIRVFVSWYREFYGH